MTQTVFIDADNSNFELRVMPDEDHNTLTIKIYESGQVKAHFNLADPDFVEFVSEVKHIIEQKLS